MSILIIFSPTDDSGHLSTSYGPQYFDWPTDIKFVLYIFLFYDFGSTSWEFFQTGQKYGDPKISAQKI